MTHVAASDVLSDVMVLDLTRVRSGPTAVRQLADWGADVIKAAPGRTRRCRGREFPPQREAAPGRRLRGAEGGQPAHHPGQHFRLRPGRPLRGPPRLRSDRPGHGRADVDHRQGRRRTDAGRDPDRRPLRRFVLRHGYPLCAARTAQIGPGPVASYLAIAGPDLHARLPGRALADGRRGGAPVRQQPSDLRADRGPGAASARPWMPRRGSTIRTSRSTPGAATTASA